MLISWGVSLECGIFHTASEQSGQTLVLLMGRRRFGVKCEVIAEKEEKRKIACVFNGA